MRVQEEIKALRDDIEAIKVQAAKHKENQPPWAKIPGVDKYVWLYRDSRGDSKFAIVPYERYIGLLKFGTAYRDKYMTNEQQTPYHEERLKPDVAQKLDKIVNILENMDTRPFVAVPKEGPKNTVVLMKTAPYGASPSAVVEEYQILQEIQNAVMDIRKRMDAYAQRGTQPSEKAPAPPLWALFEQFMQEPRNNRVYIYCYLRREERTPGELYTSMNVHLYDVPAFITLLQELPQRCII